jgi:hypothetical protein
MAYHPQQCTYNLSIQCTWWALFCLIWFPKNGKGKMRPNCPSQWKKTMYIYAGNLEYLKEVD